VARRVLIQTADFSPDQIYRDVLDLHGSKVGAVVSFVGLVRDRDRSAGDTVSTLTLEHYPGMTENSIERIIDDAQSRWSLLDLRVVHRIGTMTPSEQIVFVIAASAHRSDAFAGAEFVMDYLKTDAVFWKKESTSSGTTWIESTAADRQRAKHWTKL